MELTIRPLLPTDYEEHLVGWWREWRWTPPPIDFLPDKGAGGFMVLDGSTPVCAGFLYVTNSPVAWVDWIISNMQYRDKKKRKVALMLLIDTLTLTCQKNGFKYCYSLLRNTVLIKMFGDLGYNKGSEDATEMIKTL